MAKRFLVSLGLSLLAAQSQAVTLDGTFSASEGWGSKVATISPSNSGNLLPIDLYWLADANKVSGAFVADTTASGWENFLFFANVYVYTGSAVGGALGDGNDVFIGTNTKWFISNSGFTGPAAGYSDHVFSGTNPTYSVDGVTVGWQGTNVFEFEIDQSILGHCPQYKVGIQGWSYDMAGSQWVILNSPSQSEPGVVPTPAAWVGGVLLLGLLGGIRIYSNRRLQP